MFLFWKAFFMNLKLFKSFSVPTKEKDKISEVLWITYTWKKEFSDLHILDTQMILII